MQPEPLPLRPEVGMDRKERERIERAKLLLREEEVLGQAAKCPDCARAREESGDETALCEVHLRQVMGV